MIYRYRLNPRGNDRFLWGPRAIKARRPGNGPAQGALGSAGYLGKGLIFNSLTLELRPGAWRPKRRVLGVMSGPCLWGIAGKKSAPGGGDRMAGAASGL